MVHRVRNRVSKANTWVISEEMNYKLIKFDTIGFTLIKIYLKKFLYANLIF